MLVAGKRDGQGQETCGTMIQFLTETLRRADGMYAHPIDAGQSVRARNVRWLPAALRTLVPYTVHTHDTIGDGGRGKGIRRDWIPIGFGIARACTHHVPNGYAIK